MQLTNTTYLISLKTARALKNQSGGLFLARRLQAMLEGTSGTEVVRTKKTSRYTIGKSIEPLKWGSLFVLTISLKTVEGVRKRAGGSFLA